MHQPFGAVPSGNDAEPRLRQADLRILGHEPQIASQGQFRAAAQGIAVDRRDDRQGMSLERVEQAADDAEGLSQFLGRGNRAVGLQITPGAEETITGAGHHDTTQVRPAGRAVQCVAHGLGRVAGNRVPGLLTVDGEDQDAGAFRRANQRLNHAGRHESEVRQGFWDG